MPVFVSQLSLSAQIDNLFTGERKPASKAFHMQQKTELIRRSGTIQIFVFIDLGNR